MSNLIKITKQSIGKEKVNTVDGRELHKFLGNKQRFCSWIATRISKYKFIAGTDYNIFNGFLKSPTKLSKEYTLSIDMAKALSLIENNSLGKQARAYFINYRKETQSLFPEIVEPPEPKQEPELNSLVNATEQTMSSTQLAELLNYESKSSINKAIKKMFQAKIDDSIIAPSLDSRGYVIEYHLPELESKMFVAKKDINYLEKITRFWIDQNKNPFKDLIPKNFPDALHLAWEQAGEIMTLKNQAEVNRPKIEIADRIESTINSIQISDYVKAISKENGFVIGRNNFYKWLKVEKILNYKNLPNQRYIDQGWLEVKEGTYENEYSNGPVACFTTLITGKGQISILKRFLQSKFSNEYLNKSARTNNRPQKTA